MIQPTTAISTKVFKEPGFKSEVGLDFTTKKIIFSYEDIIQRLTDQVNQWAAENSAEIIFIAYNSEKYYDGEITDSSYRSQKDRIEFEEINRFVYCTILYNIIN